MKLKKLSVFFEAEDKKLGLEKLAADCIQAIYDCSYHVAIKKVGLSISDADRVKICCHDQAVPALRQYISSCLKCLPERFVYKANSIVYDIPRLYEYLDADLKALNKTKFYQFARIFDLKKHIKKRNQEIFEADVIAFLAYQYINVLKIDNLESFKDKFNEISQEKLQEIEKEIKTLKK